ncbi:MAG: manganese efflux pump [Clostridia bacterium]|nr:manganese efflux pump [Clostridia bacterium]
MFDFSFFFNSILLGVGLAMDAFSVSLANGLSETNMKGARMCCVAGVFSFFQFLMPLVGWVCVHTVVRYFSAFEQFVPWIALALLSYIGGKMLWDGICKKTSPSKVIGWNALLLQGVATSIDALSVGFTIADFNSLQALGSCLLIAAVTFMICMGGLFVGKKFGTGLAGKAGILGGCILIFIGFEIFITGVL